MYINMYITKCTAASLCLHNNLKQIEWFGPQTTTNNTKNTLIYIIYTSLNSVKIDAHISGHTCTCTTCMFLVFTASWPSGLKKYPKQMK